MKALMDLSDDELRRFHKRAERAIRDTDEVVPVTNAATDLQGGPAMVTTMDAAGNVVMHYESSPDDRRALRNSAQLEAYRHANSLRSGQGLASLFPSNKRGIKVRKVETQQ